MLELQSSLYVWPLILAAIVALSLVVVVWRRSGAAVVPFLALQVALVIWTISDAAALLLVDKSSKLFLANLSYLGITAVPGAWLVFVLDYTSRGRWITRRTVLLLTIEPILTTLAAFVNPYELFRTEVSYVISDGLAQLETTYGILFWIHALYSYVLLALAAGLLIQAFLRAPQLYRGQITTMLIGTFTPWVSNAVYILGLIKAPMDITPLGFVVTGFAIAISVTRYRLLDVVPVARALLFESLSDAVVVLNAQNRIVDINPAGLAIIGAESTTHVIGQFARDIFHRFGDLVPRFADVSQGRFEIVLDAGTSPRHFVLRISRLNDHSGNLTGRVLMLHEITELKQAAQIIEMRNEELRRTNRDLAIAREQSEEANRLKSEFLATMSHELRTPLNSVIGYADLILSGLMGPLPEKQTTYIQRIMSNGERLLTLINDLLDISRIEAGRMELVFTPFEPRAMLDAVHVQLQSLADQKGLAFHTQVDPALPVQLLGDRKRLEQILVNLAGNALRFTETGSVEVHLAVSESQFWTITVTDTGIGIPPHALDYIFDEFRQVDGSSKREYGGTGLGLAIVSKLAQLMGGSVTVTSEVDRGSTFTVQLPLVVDEAPLVSTEQQL